MSVVFLQGSLPHYRVQFFNELASSIDQEITVVHFSDKVNGDLNFKQVILPTVSFCGFNYNHGLLRLIDSINPDTIVGMADLRWISFLLLALFPRYRNKFIWWGLDKGSSNLSKYFQVLYFSRFKRFIFYSNSTLHKFSDILSDDSRWYVAQNSLAVPDQVPPSYGGKHFLNVGSLNYRKRNDLLFFAYQRYLQLTDNPLPLLIVGSGTELESLIKLSFALKIDKYVKFLGHIDSDSEELIELYDNAVCSLSLGQAGLSILQSFGFSRPYISFKNAISGGELENIISGYNGYLCDDIGDVVSKMLRLSSDKIVLAEMSSNAFVYYSNVASLKKMSHVFVRAINDVRGDIDGSS